MNFGYYVRKWIYFVCWAYDKHLDHGFYIGKYKNYRRGTNMLKQVKHSHHIYWVIGLWSLSNYRINIQNSIKKNLLVILHYIYEIEISASHRYVQQWNRTWAINLCRNWRVTTTTKKEYIMVFYAKEKLTKPK